MDLVDKRNRLCEKWIERIDREHKEGSITSEEYQKQKLMIKEEIDKTKEVLEHQKIVLNNQKSPFNRLVTD